MDLNDVIARGRARVILDDRPEAELLGSDDKRHPCMTQVVVDTSAVVAVVLGEPDA